MRDMGLSELSLRQAVYALQRIVDEGVVGFSDGAKPCRLGDSGEERGARLDAVQEEPLRTVAARAAGGAIRAQA